MGIRLYNTLTRKVEEFSPMGETVGLYTCGPTIYNFAHIGNFRAYVCQDVLKRHLRHRGFAVRHVMNLTDVDDKTIRDSQKEGVVLKAFTDRYKKAFFEDIAALSIVPAEAYPEATAYIEDMISLIESLMRKGVAYRGEDGSVYYNIRKFPEYGKLSKINLEGLLAGARVKQDEYSKEQANDFALWKAYDPPDGMVYWESPWGRGRPGWHIECSVMSMRNLGETFDIHCGGIDLIFPHHEDEIAQSEAATGKKFANYWVHNEHLLVNGKKMSKSMGNFYTLRDVLSRGYSGKSVRYLLISTQYRQQLNFTFQALDAAQAAVGSLEELVRNLKAREEAGRGAARSDMLPALVESSRRAFDSAMDADLNTPEALSAVFAFAHEMNRLMGSLSAEDAQDALRLLSEFDSVLGVLGEAFSEKEALPPEVEELVAKREEARAGRDWKMADSFRAQIEAFGYAVQDRKDGAPAVRKIRPERR